MMRMSGKAARGLRPPTGRRLGHGPDRRPPGAHDPVTVGVTDRGRRCGTYIVRPGRAAFVGHEGRGPVTLTWTGPDGKPRTKRAIVLEPARVELSE